MRLTWSLVAFALLAFALQTIAIALIQYFFDDAPADLLLALLTPILGRAAPYAAFSVGFAALTALTWYHRVRLVRAVTSVTRLFERKRKPAPQVILPADEATGPRSEFGGPIWRPEFRITAETIGRMSALR